ncbi:AAA family ATPase [Bosea sp. (in: a-proteobacteria)]|uniref:AAA family ATPase n=1 Tax=Bosea sp. (in: a-proteobacteria) TaxID=1871050 RepID=UPI0026049B34|nr:AAA family ATPase [Bosea sp. (in: a-proteobacteria)]MCO5089875.1 AAA family ATPase [Bosea sp. (in: a-proteobacteria)]
MPGASDPAPHPNPSCSQKETPAFAVTKTGAKGLEMNPLNIRADAAGSKPDELSPLAQNIDGLVAAGYRDFLRPLAKAGDRVSVEKRGKHIEIVSDGKLPSKYAGSRWYGLRGWTHPRQVTDADIRTWRLWPDAGLCLALGEVVAIDIDIKIPTTDHSFAAERARTLVAKIRELVGAEVGRRPDTLATRTRSGTTSTVIFLRAGAEFFKRWLSFGDGYKIEFLAHGQQVVIAGWHKSGDPQHTNLARHAFDSLPVLSQDAFDNTWKQIREAIEAAGFSITEPAGRSRPGKRQAPRTQNEIIWAEAMRRRAEWLPSLLPPEVTVPPSGGLRISSEDLERELEEDLAIFPDGIHDYGTERGHTPLSFIQEFGTVTADGGIEYGGCPEYGERDGELYAVVSEPDPNVLRPSRPEAITWLCRVLGGPVPTADASMGDLARALGLDDLAIGNHMAALYFKDEDNVVPIVPPEQWQPAQIRANRSRLPIMRATNPEGFEKLKVVWEDSFVAAPAEVDTLIAEEIERVRRGPSSAGPSTDLTHRPDLAPVPPDACRADLRVVTGLISPAGILVREWLLDPLLPFGDATQCIGEPGIGKSSLMLLFALVVATGREDILRGKNATGQPISPVRLHRPGPVLIYNAEDRLAEMERRLAAAQRHFGVTDADMKHDIILWSGVDNEHLTLMCRPDGRSDLKRAPGFARLEAVIRKHGVVMVALDPQRSLTGGVENSTEDAEALFQALARLASETKTSIVVVHHPNKTTRENAGDMMAGSGSSAAAGKVRSSFTATNVRPDRRRDDEKDWNLDGPNARLIRIDHGKLNHGEKLSTPLVYRRVSVPVGNGSGVRPEAAAALFDQDPRAALEMAGDMAPVLELVNIATLTVQDGPKAPSAHAEPIARIINELIGDRQECSWGSIWNIARERMREAGVTKAKVRSSIQGQVISALLDGVAIKDAGQTVRIHAEQRGQSDTSPWIMVKTVIPPKEAS